MADAPHPLTQLRFGATARRDAWWVQPASSSSSSRRSSSTRPGPPSRATHYTYGPYLSPFYSPELFGARRTRWFGPKPGVVAGVAAVLARAADPAVSRAVPPHLLLLPRRLLQGVLGRPARLRRRRAAEAVPGRGLVPADPAEHPPLLPVRRAALPPGAAPRRVEGALVHRPRHRPDVVRHRRGHAGARARTWCCSAATRWAATRCATWSAATSTGSPATRCARAAYDCVELPQPRPHAVGLVQPLLRGLRRPLRPPLLHGRLDRLADPLTEYQTFEHDVLVIGAGGAGLRAAIEASARGRLAWGSSASRCWARRTR